MKSVFFLLVSLLLAPCFALADSPAESPGSIPVTLTLPRAGMTTLVIDDAQGNRVRNLISETLLPQGKNTITWDGYDNGDYAENGDLVRHRVPPGVYHLRGMVHDKIMMRYEFSVNSPGTPPWKTRDGSGGWLADHTPPGDILFLPLGVTAPNGKGLARFLVCSSSGESGEEFIWLDAEGRRLYGTNTGFWGGMFLARDPGPHPLPGIYAYTFTSGERDPDNNNLEVRAFHRANERANEEGSGVINTVYHATFPMAWKKTILPTFKTIQESYGTNGLAVYNGRIVIAMTHLNQLIVADARSGQEVARIALPSPRGLTFDAAGHLYVLTNKQVRRYTLSSDGTKLLDSKTLITQGLLNPRRLSLDPAGNLYISDWGASHQIKVFSPNGRLLHLVGKPGGPQLGLYDPLRMSYPSGATVDDQGHLWVAEGDQFPKRLSQWKTDGTFIQSWYGGPKYGGGGAIDAADPTRYFYAEYEHGGGTEYALDWKQGTYKPKAIYWRPDATPDRDLPPGPAPERAFTVGGHTYLTNCYNGQLRENQDRGTALWLLDKNHVAHPIVLISDAADLDHPQWGWPMKNKAAINALWQGQDPGRVLFIWSDKNGDGVAQPNEVQFIVSNRKDAQGNFLEDVGLMPLVQPDLSITTSYGTLIPAPKIDSQGTPLYDLSKMKIVGNPSRLRSPLLSKDWTLADQDGIAATLGADIQGKRLWKYNHTAEARLGGPGLMVSPSRILGPPVTPTAGEAGSLIAITGEKGVLFLMTLDGLFVQSLGGDARNTPLWRDPALFHRGALIDDVSFEDEHFHPTLDQLNDGQIYLVAGKEHSSILRLEGFETVKRLDLGDIALSDAVLTALPETQVEKAHTTERNILTVSLAAAAPTVDGSLTDWPAATQWVALDSRASAALIIAGDRLYAAYKTEEPHALSNGGGDYHYLFKKGGALDLMLGSDPNADARRQSPVPGDERLLVTQVNGKTQAVLYKAVVPGTSSASAFEYASPIGKAVFDQVTDISDQVQLAQSGGNYEFSVPLSALGLSVKPSDTLLGDIGLLRGSSGQTTQRLYWNNQDTLIVSDLPSEARLEPGNWGILQLK